MATFALYFAEARLHHSWEARYDMVFLGCWRHGSQQSWNFGMLSCEHWSFTSTKCSDAIRMLCILQQFLAHLQGSFGHVCPIAGQLWVDPWGAGTCWWFQIQCAAIWWQGHVGNCWELPHQEACQGQKRCFFIHFIVAPLWSHTSSLTRGWPSFSRAAILTWDRSLYKDVWRAGRQPSIASEYWQGFTIFTKVAAGGFHCKKLTRAFQWWWALVELASHDKRAQTTSPRRKATSLRGIVFPLPLIALKNKGPMVTPGLAGFPLQGQSTGLSNNIPKRIATSQKGMIVLPTQNEGLTDSMILKESLNTLTAEKVKHYESNNTENIGFDKKIKKTKKQNQSKQKNKLENQNQGKNKKKNKKKKQKISTPAFSAVFFVFVFPCFFWCLFLSIFFLVILFLFLFFYCFFFNFFC